MVEAIESVINWFAQPPIYVTVASVLSIVMFFSRHFWTKRAGAVGLVLGIAFLVFSLQNAQFRSIILYPDNVPIAGMLVLVFFFTWLSMFQAYRNDERVQEEVNRILLEQYRLVPKDDIHADAMSHLCNILGASGNPRYADTLYRVSKTAESSKLRKYASKNLGRLR